MVPVALYRAFHCGDIIAVYQLLAHTSVDPDVTSFPEYQQQKLQLHMIEQLIELFNEVVQCWPPHFQCSHHPI